MKHPDLRCSFCGKSHEDVVKLIAGPKVYICDQCIVLCSGIIEGKKEDSEELAGRNASARSEYFEKDEDKEKLSSMKSKIYTSFSSSIHEAYELGLKRGQGEKWSWWNTEELIRKARGKAALIIDNARMKFRETAQKTKAEYGSEFEERYWESIHEVSGKELSINCKKLLRLAYILGEEANFEDSSMMCASVAMTSFECGARRVFDSIQLDKERYFSVLSMKSNMRENVEANENREIFLNETNRLVKNGIMVLDRWKEERLNTEHLLCGILYGEEKAVDWIRGVDTLKAESERDDLLAELRQSIEARVDATDFDTHYDLGIAYKEMGLTLEAITELEKCIGSRQRRFAAIQAMAAHLIGNLGIEVEIKN